MELPVETISFVAVLFLLLLSSFFLFKRATAHKRKEPPEVTGGWPIIGHLQLLKANNSQLPHETLGSLADKYGPIFRIRIGAQPTLIISSSELAKQCHTTLDSIVSSRPKNVGGKLLGYNYAAFGTRAYDSFYRSMRKIVVSEVLSNRCLELQRDVKVCEVTKSLKEVYSQWIKREEGSDYVLVDVEEFIGNINLKVVLMMVCGKRFLGGCGEDEEMKRCRKVMRDILDLMGKFVVGDSIPFLRWLDVGGYEKAMKITSKKFDSLLEEWLEDHRRRRNSGPVDGEHEDFMGLMLSNLKGMDLAGYDADTVNKATCMPSTTQLVTMPPPAINAPLDVSPSRLRRRRPSPLPLRHCRAHPRPLDRRIPLDPRIRRPSAGNPASFTASAVASRFVQLQTRATGNQTSLAAHPAHCPSPAADLRWSLASFTVVRRISMNVDKFWIHDWSTSECATC